VASARAMLRRVALDAACGECRWMYAAERRHGAAASGRRGRRGRGAFARRTFTASNQSSSAYTCVDIDESSPHVDSYALRRCCAALRVRCFYEFVKESGGGDASDGDACARLAWWNDRITSETTRATSFARAGMRDVRTFAALEDVAEDEEDAYHAGEAREDHEHPVDVAALRRWSSTASFPDVADLGTRVRVIGTLDVHMGRSLPGESLVGIRPVTPSADDDNPIHIVSPPRAYAFNVCVSPESRGIGVAEALLNAAKAHVAAKGARVLYVHCERDNAAAKSAYEKAGFSIEVEESDADADALAHTPRILLFCDLP